MNETQLEQLRFPIGKWEKPGKANLTKIKKQISFIKKFPNALKKEIAGLSEEQLEKKYREGGWTIRQVVHHCADSHLNAFTRFKLTLTEEEPTIKTYRENFWAELEDGKNAPVKYSLQILQGLHARWTILMRSMKKEEWDRSFIHPEHGGEMKLFQLVSLYAWHSEHHLAHITLAKKG
ncbi:MAG: putative metal-dependent hydrolase [Bacteroidetes bacterium]|nr:putative metal-dependent hydrolase [Bacteroidota bacterium]